MVGRGRAWEGERGVEPRRVEELGDEVASGAGVEKKEVAVFWRVGA